MMKKKTKKKIKYVSYGRMFHLWWLEGEKIKFGFFNEKSWIEQQAGRFMTNVRR